MKTATHLVVLLRANSVHGRLLCLLTGFSMLYLNLAVQTSMPCIKRFIERFPYPQILFITSQVVQDYLAQ